MHENKVVSSILGFWKMYTALRLLLRAKDQSQLPQLNFANSQNAWAEDTVLNNEEIIWKKKYTNRKVNKPLSLKSLIFSEGKKYQ